MKVCWTQGEVLVHSAWMCELDVSLKGAFYATDPSPIVSISRILKAGSWHFDAVGRWQLAL